MASQLITKLLSLHPSSFNEKPCLCFLLLGIGECSNTAPLCLNDISIHGSILFTLTVALHVDNDHIRYYHMHARWLVGLVQNYFFHPDYLIIQCWVHATLLFTGSITQKLVLTIFFEFFPREWWAACMRDSSLIALWQS